MYWIEAKTAHNGESPRRCNCIRKRKPVFRSKPSLPVFLERTVGSVWAAMKFGLLRPTVRANNNIPREANLNDALLSLIEHVRLLYSKRSRLNVYNIGTSADSCGGLVVNEICPSASLLHRPETEQQFGNFLTRELLSTRRLMENRTCCVSGYQDAQNNQRVCTLVKVTFCLRLLEDLYLMPSCFADLVYLHTGYRMSKVWKISKVSITWKKMTRLNQTRSFGAIL